MPEKGNFCHICGGDNSLEPEIIIDPEELIFDEAELPADDDALLARARWAMKLPVAVL